MTRSKTKPVKRSTRRTRIYTLTAFLTREPPAGDPLPASVASRTLQVRGDQTLEELHRAIATAYERAADYSYEFQLDAGPLHPEGRRYVEPAEFALARAAGPSPAGRVTDTTVDDLALGAGQTFTYWPDAGQEWWHPVRVDRIAQAVPRGLYPRVVEQAGASPFGGQDAGDDGSRPRAMGAVEGADTACLVGEMHLSKGEYHKAIEAFTRALEARPTVDAYQGRAQAFRRLAAADERAATRLRHA